MENDIDLNGEQIINDFREYQQELKKEKLMHAVRQKENSLMIILKNILCMMFQ